MPHVHEAVGRELEETLRGQKGISFKRAVSDQPVPHALTEPDDMLIVQPPCHPWEPIKVPEQHDGQLYCLLCGTPFAA